ncbi:putative ankyrin repeat-containing domain-containing protein [Helianthus annuus]|nr:putative ankyrin repeat-containing domain-containing protein [Helianthus annuus]
MLDVIMLNQLEENTKMNKVLTICFKWNYFEGPRENYLKVGVPLYEAAIKCNWNAAKAILEKKKELVRFSNTENGETALHVAASSKGDPKNVEEFVRNLVDLMEKEDLALENESFNTALYLAAAAGNIKTVKIMVEKNNILQDNPRFWTNAATILSNELRDDCWNPENRGWLLEKCVENDMFDIALEIVKKYPDLVRGAILGILARKPKAFDETNSNIITRTIKTGKQLKYDNVFTIFEFLM